MTPEWSLPVVAAHVPAAGQEIEAEADAAVRAAVAVRLDLPAIAALRLVLRLVPCAGGGITARGRLDTRLTQVCVVTLEPFESELSLPIDLRFVPGADADAELDPEAPDEVAIEAGVLDVGEAAVQSLSLGLDPWPRAPGSALPDAAAPEGGPAHPFAALAGRIRDRDV